MKKSLLYAAILGLVGFVTSFGAHIVAVNLPVYAKEVGIGLTLIGLLIAVYDFAEIAAKPVFGWIADRNSMKTTLMLGIGVFIGASLLYLVIPPGWLVLVRFLQGVGAAALSAVSLALVGVYYQENRGRAYGIYNALKGAGYVLSPLVGGYLLTQTRFSALFLACAAVGVLALGLSLLLPADQRKGQEGLDDDDDDLSFRTLLDVFRDARLRRWYSVIVLNMFFVSILFGFLPVRVYALHYSPLETGWILSAVALSFLLIQPLAGYWADRLNVIVTIRLGLALSALTLLVIPFVTGLGLLLVALLAGIGIGVVWTNTDTLVSRLAASGQLGATMGAAGSFKELGDMLGPVTIGLIAQTFGLTTGFVVCSVLGGLAILLIGREPTQPIAKEPLPHPEP